MKNKILETYCPFCKTDFTEGTEVYRNKVTGEIIGCENCVELVYPDLSDERWQQELQDCHDNMLWQQAKDERFNL